MKKTNRTIEAKPCEYKGVLMRSKTEAACARWLDENKLSWIYEPEQFRGKGVYTPDFYLPQIKTMIEVKPLAFIGEIDRIKPIVEDMDMTFVVLDRTSEWEFEIIDMYAPLMPCDPYEPGDVKTYGWMDYGSGYRDPQFGYVGGKHDTHKRFYLGGGCHLKYSFGGDCICTR